MGAGVGTVVEKLLREPETGVFSLSSRTKVGLGVLVTSVVGAIVGVGLAAGLARPSESLPPRASQLSVKNNAKNAKTANLDTIRLPGIKTAANPTLFQLYLNTEY